ncbi:MAG: hypothetical protein V8R22_05670 [Lachnospiraceae bacterium]
MEKDMDVGGWLLASEEWKCSCEESIFQKKDLYFEADLHMEVDENGRVQISATLSRKEKQ